MIKVSVNWHLYTCICAERYHKSICNCSDTDDNMNASIINSPNDEDEEPRDYLDTGEGYTSWHVCDILQMLHGFCVCDCDDDVDIHRDHDNCDLEADDEIA